MSNYYLKKSSFSLEQQKAELHFKVNAHDTYWGVCVFWRKRLYESALKYTSRVQNVLCDSPFKGRGVHLKTARSLTGALVKLEIHRGEQQSLNNNKIFWSWNMQRPN